MLSAVTREVAKSVVDHIPHTKDLTSFTNLSIKLKDEMQIDRAVMQNRMSKSNIEPIEFLIRNEDHQKVVIMTAELRPKEGFVVAWQFENQVIMKLALPKQSENVLGKIQHPTSATLYKVATTSEPGIFRIDSQLDKNRAPSVTQMINRQSTCLLDFLHKHFGLYDDSKTLIQTCDQTLATIRPKYTALKGTPVTMVQFGRFADCEQRAIAIATALLIHLAKAHPRVQALFEQLNK